MAPQNQRLTLGDSALATATEGLTPLVLILVVAWTTTETNVIKREELYELVWSMPMTKIAEKFEVSGTYLARVCTVLRVPRPERGYWAKLAVGKAPQRPALPEPLPGGLVVWSRTDELPSTAVPKPRSTPGTCVPRLAWPVTGTHGLIRGAKEHFLASRKVDDAKHLKPYKKLLVDITVSRSGLDKALGFANDLFNALETARHRVVIAPPDGQFRRERVQEKEELPKKDPRHDPYGYDRLWSPYRPTVAYVDSLVFGLAIVEMTESVAMRYVNGEYIRESDYVPPKAFRRYVDHTWTTNQDLPSGRLRLLVYSPYHSVSWSTSFQESKTRSLTLDIPRIVKAMENATATVTEKLREAERQAEIWRQERLAEEERRRQEEDRQRAAQSLKDSRDQFEQIIQSWAKVVSLEQFFRGVEDRAQNLPEAERQAVLERLRLAREFIGTQDPLDFFRGWKTPIERYVPLSLRAAHSPAVDEADGDQEDGEAAEGR